MQPEEDKETEQSESAPAVDDVAEHPLLTAANDALYKLEAYLYELDEENSAEDLRALNQVRYPPSGPTFSDLEHKMRSIKSLLAD